MLYYIVENDGLPARAFTIKEGEDLARKDRLLQTTMLVTLVIIASKAVGFIREMVVAHYFGTLPENDAYVAAYALFYIPVLLLNSCITATLVPMYTEARARRGLARADRFASNTINILALMAVGLSLLMLLLAGPLVRLVYPGYTPEMSALTRNLCAIMVLTLAFNITSIALASLLNAQEKYIAAQITGFPLSFAIILAATLFARTYGVRALAWGVFAANILQTLVLVPFMRGWFSYRLIVDFRDRRFRRLLMLAGPAVLSMAVSELNHMVDQWRASYGDPGDVSALSYGYKVITLLTGVVIVPLTTIMFSRMSRMWRKRPPRHSGDRAAFHRDHRHGDDAHHRHLRPWAIRMSSRPCIWADSLIFQAPPSPRACSSFTSSACWALGCATCSTAPSTPCRTRARPCTSPPASS